MPDTISITLTSAVKHLTAVTDVPKLEAEILLAHVLNVSRVHLHTWPEKIITAAQQKIFQEFISRRAKGEPIAYLIGHREFWSLDLLVTPDVLIPRPETELLVETILQQFSTQEKITIADLGTGSGAIALALAHEKPNWIIHATDKSTAALNIAKQNAKNHHLTNVIFHQGIWCNALPKIKFDAIVSNPPYIAENDTHLTQGDLPFEPRSALVSSENGLSDLTQIILESRDYLKPHGFIFLEHGFEQAKNVAGILEKARYTSIKVKQDLAGLERVAIATWVG